MTVTGADLTGLTAINRTAEATSTLAADTARGARQAGETLEQQVGEATGALRAEFTTVFDDFRSRLTAATNQVNEMPGSGQARRRMLEAVNDYHQVGRGVEARAQNGIRAFEKTINTKARALNEDLESRFSRLMLQAESTFRQYGRSVTAYGTALQNADQSVTYV